MPQEKLVELLEGIGDGSIGMDCSIVASRYDGFFQVSTTDFFFPLVDDPYLQGRIAAANVLSDMYALGLSECDNVLMLVCSCLKMGSSERDIVLRQMMAGFNAAVEEAGSKVTGGQTTLNEWPLIGGVAMAVAKEEDFVRPEHAEAGDLVVLTKPLGTQVAVNLWQWHDVARSFWDRFGLEQHLDETAVAAAYDAAAESMGRLNRNGARLMHKHNAHAATDVTGFGILGHLKNLAAAQRRQGLRFVLDTLPVLRHMPLVDRLAGNIFRLLEGYSAETSGGLLVIIPANNAQAFVEDIQALDQQPCWIIGRVEAMQQSDAPNEAKISDNVKILEV